MNHQEQLACSEWFRSIMAEGAGQGRVVTSGNVFQKLGLVNINYSTQDVRRVLCNHLPEELECRMRTIALVYRGYWWVWSCLSDADIGTIMQAGAARFLLPAEETSHV